MAAQQQTIARPLLIVAVILCTVLFTYVILTQRHETTDQVASPYSHPTDRAILGNTKIALPLRHQTPTQFGSPVNVYNTSPATVAPALTTPSSAVALPVIAGAGSYSNLYPILNPKHPLPVSTGPGGLISLPHPVVATSPSRILPPVTFGQPVAGVSHVTVFPFVQSTAVPTSVTPAATPAAAVPLSSGPAYTVLVKGPGDRTRKAVIVNH